MTYYILDTRNNFIDCELENFYSHIGVYGSETRYLEGTTRWADERQRFTDYKYVCPVSPYHINTSGWVVEVLNTGGEWFPFEDG